MDRQWLKIAHGLEPRLPSRPAVALRRTPKSLAGRPLQRLAARTLPRLDLPLDAGAVSEEAASELDCLRGVLAPAVLNAAGGRAAELGIGAEQVLIDRGVIDERGYLRHLARYAGLTVERFDGVRRADCPLSDDDLVRAATYGILPLRRAGRLGWVIAPRGTAARYLAAQLAGRRAGRAGISLAATGDFDRFLMEAAGGVMGRAAVEGLQRRFPAMSAAPMPRAVRSRWRHLMWVMPLALVMMLAPALLADAAGSVVALGFLAFASLRIAAAAIPVPPVARPRRLAERELPIYSVIVALYREAASVEPLIDALEALDYPREKLDIIIVVEPDDRETRDALARARDRRGAMPHLQVIVAPRGGPRTKPKALACALPFAHGSFVAVYDAEDRPDPGQLRAALEAFRRGGPDVACAQAALCIDNRRESWLARMFGVEYAGQFDAFLPGLATLGLPLPLGGSSNHFRAGVLRDVGGWDCYNVTEDADLGMRLSRFGYRAVTFASTTYEEAPVRFTPWLRQRTRWMKGWLQTWAVHMRAPRQLWRDAGARGWLTLNLLVGGNVLTALLHPLLLGGIALGLATEGGWPAFALPEGGLAALHIAAIAAGYLATLVVGLIGLARRGRLADGWVLLLTPIYWLYLSCAAWRALGQMLTDPYRWEKTDHGSARRDGSQGGAEG